MSNTIYGHGITWSIERNVDGTVNLYEINPYSYERTLRGERISEKEARQTIAFTERPRVPFNLI